MKTFYTLLLFYLCVQPVFSQQDSLLENIGNGSGL